jgi:hypothetical protein
MEILNLCENLGKAITERYQTSHLLLLVGMSTDLIQPLLRFLVLGTVQTEREPNSRSASLGLEQNNRSHTHHLDLRPTLINRASDCNNSQKIYNSNNSHKSQEISIPVHD